MKSLFSGILFIYLIIIFAYSQDVKTIQVNFSRELQKEHTEELSKGNIYYQKNKVIVEITEPIRQWMFLEAESILIYYPDENEALRFKNTIQTNFPFLEFFIKILNDNFGLTELGYHIDKNEFVKDTLFTFWLPNEKYKDRLGLVKLALYNNRVVYSESRTPSGSTQLKTFFKKYITCKSKPLPLNMTIIRYLNSGAIAENIVYSNPILDEPLPPEITEFSIPETVHIEDME